MLKSLVVIALVGVLPGCVFGNVINGNRLLREPIILPGQCDTGIPGIPNFDLQRYQGRWYEVESYFNGFYDGDCSASDYVVTSSGVMGFTSTQVSDRNLHAIEGSAVSVGNGQFIITLVSDPSNPVISFNVIEYRVLATDYESYSLGYSCTNNADNTKRIYSWKLSRSTELTQAARSAIDEVIAQLDELDNSNYIVKDHSDLACYVFPLVVPGQAVIMDGQCPSAAELPIVQNFDLERYQGLWYDIESYYNRVQDGVCVDSNFVSTDNGFAITGSQVINRSLVNNYAAAFLTSTDGSARFEMLYSDETDDTISFEITEYWVLATDYDSYSLIYSCSNVSPTSKAVYAWKQSRTRALTDTARSEIDAIMENILELDDRFFFPTAHTYDACFYYPNPVPNQIVEFRGQCQDVPTMQNFNVANFLGTWSEISSYPTGVPSRGCISYELSQTNLGLSITRLQVVNGEVQTFAGSIEWDEGNARFDITFNIGGTDLTLPLWIIDTDYENYALVYSCVALDSERKEVFSWKFGRDRLLPPSSNAAISEAIAPVLALDERYYEIVDQTGVACLIPVFPIEHDGNEILFSGRCEDTNVPVVQNFNFNRFQGQWYDIELYYNPVQIGECNEVEYSVESDTVLEILKTQVVNGTQISQTGKATLISNDGSAIFDVETANFNEDSIISFVRAQYSVVATDYDSYALLYACTNLDDNQRRIYSWKQSRTRQLTATAQENINNIVAQIDILDNQYFNQKDHSDEACLIVETPDIPDPIPEVPAGSIVIFPGQCDDNIPVVQNIDLERYQGTWYDIEMYFNNAQTGQCTAGEYNFESTGVLNFTNTQVLGGLPTSQTGVATLIPSVDGSAKFEVVFANTDEDSIISFARVEYWVLATDYDSYSLVYSCVNQLDNTMIVYSWKQSRTRQLTDTAREAINAVVAQVDVLDDQYFQVKDHSDEACLIVIPEPEPAPVPTPDNVVVVFEGQCDDSIPVVQNIDLARYQGTWYDIEMYYNNAQTGECTAGEYEFGSEGVLNFTNTQVLGGLPTSQTGVATLIPSVDGSAKFEVVFANTDEDSIISFARVEYWILATDYDSYSLVYSCVNQPDNTKIVYSWKQGRTRQLTDSAREAINAVVAQVDVLDDQYFQVKDHSDEACLIVIPEPEPAPVPTPDNVVVVFEGQCDDSIPVVQNIDLARYQGTWYDIEMYYNNAQTGECTAGEYEFGSEGVLNFTNTQVLGGLPTSQTGVATLIPSVDGSAKFEVVFANTDEDSIISFARVEYWILATDYDSYSLVYSCVNQPDNTKIVYSWKQSRTRQLTDSAREAINAVVAQVDVLGDQYFQIKDHSDEACLIVIPEPEPAPLPTPDNVVVVFEGQCDDSIPVVQNIDLARYQGTWYDIEMYYNNAQTGECTAAEYEFGSEGVLNFTNTQVLGGLPTLQTGVATLISSADGSAKFEVVFANIDEDSIISFARVEYWILATDYDSYSLVYSCVNQPDNTKIVYSWKQSRTRQLTDTAREAINAVVVQVDVLDDQYFQVKDHSDEACLIVIPEVPEPAPEPVPVPDGIEIIFEGQCDDSIPVVQNIDLNRYQGIWYDIEMYYNNAQTGQCTVAVYDLESEAVLNFTNTQVLNGIQTSQIGVATLIPSADGSAKFEVSLANTDDDSIISFARVEYWILATDYDSYSLVYSCVNLPDNRKRVYSWKQSRTTQLTDSAREAIDAVVQTIDVLDDVYFQAKDHSDEACLLVDPFVPTGNQIVLPGQCEDEVPAFLQNYDPLRYLGTWYEVESYPDFLEGGSCKRRQYGLTPDGLITFQSSYVANQSLVAVEGSGVFVSSDGSGRMLVTYNIPGPDGTEGFLSFQYWILDTDYESYSFAYSCQNVDESNKMIYSWKLSRTPQLTPAANTAIDSIISQYSMLNNDYYSRREHTDELCFFYPTIPAGQPIIVDGQCSDDIPAVTNIDIGRYAGTWYNIESYYIDFLRGTCGIYEHTASSNSLFVSVDQVIGQELNNAQASLVPVGSNGRFDVVFSSEEDDGAISFGFGNFYVLATDYDSYSLGYSCTNVSPNTKQLGSWKLSRTRDLTPAANTAINAVVNSFDDLHNGYFTAGDHSDEGCFFYPELVAGQAVTFNGQCSDNIAVVENFDNSRFQGVWNEISSYPTLRQEGSCISYDFSSETNNVLGVTLTQILGGDAILNNGSLTRTGTDSRFTANVNLGGQDIAFPFWILDTDYDNYAIAYSCINLPDNRKEIYSWKLGREKELSTGSNNAINLVQAVVDVLDDRYYGTTDQKDDACTVLPNLGPNQPVILSGQCNPNIIAVQNFNVTGFQGQWYSIEQFYSEFLDGDCNGISLVANADGTLSVIKSSVANGALNTAFGTATLADPNQEGKLDVAFILDNPDDVISYITTQVWILTTDYDSYALLYACENLTPDTRRIFSWKFSRSRQLTPVAENAINAAVNQVTVLDDRYYSVKDHSDGACAATLDPLPGGDTIIFSGQCNPNIPVVQNFDAARYMGLWFDIESYPERFQFGTCPTATYNLNEAGFVEVYNTQVVDRNLDEIYGTAVVDSDDGSAKLVVTFPIAGTNLTIDSPYWVLATDYDNYALVYSCINLDSETFQVTSWKLSRQTTLNANSQTAINQIVNAIAVLDNRFFNVRGHSNSDCLYYPDNNGEPVILVGSCEPQNTVSNFNANAFTGIWFEESRYPLELQTGDCSTTEVQVDSAFLSFSNSFVDGGNPITLDGLANIDAVSNGTFNVAITFPNGAIEFVPLSILDTDYTSYAFLYSCRNLGNVGGGLNQKQVFSWKLSRSREGLSNQANQNINAIINNVDDLHAPYYRPADQSGSACLYYPEFGPDADAIILPGTCSENIQGVPNFDAGAYLGLWFEISSYPVPSQDNNAQCSRAEYSANNNNGVDVFNTLVINQTLDIQTGVATVASTDGSGVLDVTFVLSNGAVVNANYYILATDYNNYALVYSCRNVGEFSRQVSSWILSRERTLTNQFYNIINPVIDATEGLREEYYRPTSQSDEDCFYIPEVDPTSPVIFNGQCEDVTGVQGFDISRYAGWWHEIEAYPTGEIDGTCTSSRIQSSNNQYLAIDTTVFELSSNVTTSTLAVSNNGRIVKTSNGVATELWVLATDYETYSVVYSCENIDSVRRRVWSAIHSKSRSITPLATQSIQATIASNQVLISELYLPVDQSDDACFHYPEISGQRVIIPGQCDNNIPVVQNFDVARYGGTWYQIEKYPQQWESGTCVGARYTLDDQTGVVAVLNWEVIDGVLDTIEGTAVAISTDGSAKLLVTLPVVGTTETTTYELFVLTTDYDSYSLAYSCENLNQYERAIGAWKLSRSRELPSEGSAVINNVINQRQELHAPYFEQIVQNADCDEPSSGHIVSSTLLVILFCAILQRLY